MAYADKVTTMRRVALISSHPENSGVIQWEGVDIEGVLLLKEVDYQGITTAVVKQELIEDWLNNRSLQVKYQDPEGEDRWEPRQAVKS